MGVGCVCGGKTDLDVDEEDAVVGVAGELLVELLLRHGAGQLTATAGTTTATTTAAAATAAAATACSGRRRRISAVEDPAHVADDERVRGVVVEAELRRGGPLQVVQRDAHYLHRSTASAAAVLEAAAKGAVAGPAAAPGNDSERLRNGALRCVDEE
jgi:hypothetical protein